jgi:hypothetical protein
MTALSTVTCTIPAGESLSSAADCSWTQLYYLITPGILDGQVFSGHDVNTIIPFDVLGSDLY